MPPLLTSLSAPLQQQQKAGVSLADRSYSHPASVEPRWPEWPEPAVAAPPAGQGSSCVALTGLQEEQQWASLGGAGPGQHGPL